MKKILYIFAIAAAALFPACDLDREIETEITPKYANFSYDYTMERANGLYGPLQQGFRYFGNAMMASATDEAEFVTQSSEVQTFNLGSWSSRYNPDNKWAYYFDAIRRCNLFLENSENVDFEKWRLDPDPSAQIIYQTNLAKLENRKKEARFLRAYYHFELLKRYGGIPVMDRTYGLRDDYRSITRASIRSVADFIDGECIELGGEEGLPVKYEDNSDFGRVTRGAALALRSRLLLYLASDLFNDPSWAQGYANPEYISVTGDRTEKWAYAAEAALDFITGMDGVYSLANDYSKFGKDMNLPELIWFRMENMTNDIEHSNSAIGFIGGGTGNTPTGNLVDAYQMNDGTAFDWDNPDHKTDPYANRDPRLKMTILTNNEVYKGRPVEIWEGGQDAPPIEFSTRTGYYLRKFLDEDLNLVEGNTSRHFWTYFRLAEIYLNYAEALNESDPGNPDIKKYIDLVRGRTGVGMPEMPAGSQAEVRKFIRNERRVELAFEDHRAWDTRRWMTAGDQECLKIKGVRVTGSAQDAFTYEPFDVEERVFSPQMYFYPIPLSEVNVTGWPQNPLW